MARTPSGGFGLGANVLGLAAATDMLEDLSPDSETAQWTVGPTVDYAKYQEYGTAFHPPQPFMRPAAQTVQANIGTHVRGASSLDDAIKSAAMAVEREAKERAPVDTGQLRASIQAQPGGN